MTQRLALLLLFIVAGVASADPLILPMRELVPEHVLRHVGEETSGERVDGSSRTVSDIRDRLTAEMGPVPLEYVSEHLHALEEIDVIRSR